MSLLTTLRGPLNRLLINRFASNTTPRPRAFSLWSPNGDPNDTGATDYITDYTSWPGLTDKRYSGRHLPPAPVSYTDKLLPDTAPTGQQTGEITRLFARQGPMKPSRSSALFMFFAQWFTDSVLRIDFRDRRRNTSNHDIDLCQIYGLTEDVARLLRSGQDGMLRSQTINGEEYLDYLCESDGHGSYRPRAHYAGLPAAQVGLPSILDGFDEPARREKLYATGLERGNSSIGYAAISTIFMREHNRICRALKGRNAGWSDERLFQTARNVNIVLLMKLVVEDYINHILGRHVFELDHEFAEEQSWYRENWIAIEFDLLYRWHGLVPDELTVGGRVVPARNFRNDNVLLEQIGVGALIASASSQRAGRIGLRNSPEFLWRAEYESIRMSRLFRLRPYNEYRVQFGLEPKRSFADLTADPALQEELRRIYKTIDDVEFFVGIFAEDAPNPILFGDLLTRMVAYDAFTQIFSNPLLSKRVYNAATFSDYGLDLIKKTRSIEDLVNRNVATPVKVSLGVG